MFGIRLPLGMLNSTVGGPSSSGPETMGLSATKLDFMSLFASIYFFIMHVMNFYA